jgi:uncharacterized protein (TIGR02270 family)
VVPFVVNQHTEEAAILWLRRDRAVDEPHYNLADLAKVDGQVEGHIDGLRIAGDAAWDVCCQELKWEEPGGVFAASALALEDGQTDRIQSVLEIAVASPELDRGFVSALGWLSADAAVKQLPALVTSNEPPVRRIGLAGHAVRRQDLGPVLANFVKDDDARVRTRAVKAMAELGRADLVPMLWPALRDQDDDCRFYAAWSAARFAQRGAPVIDTLKSFAVQPGPRQQQALAMAVRSLGVPAAKAWLHQLAKDWQHLRLATIGAGVLGDPELIGVLIELMKNDDVARVAGESFSMITGVDLAYDDLERDRPEGFESGPTEDAADENLALDEDENLAWPDAELVGKWWSANVGRFQPGHRYLCGREISVESARKTLVDGKQRQRAAAATELAMLQPHQPLFEVRARGDWQRKWLKC